MQFWFVHSSDIPLRQQIVTQVWLGVLSGELAPGEKLPSVRSFARRFDMHANTVSAAYGQLQTEAIVVLRKGSGVYVNPSFFPKQGLREKESQHLLVSLVQRAVAVAHQAGYSDSQIHSLVDTALLARRTLVLVEADPELARIACFEIEAAGRQAPELCSLSPDCFTELSNHVSGRTPVFFASKAGAARAALGNSSPMVVLNINSAATSLVGQLPPSREYLVAIVSSWARFLDITRAMLISCGFDSEALMVRDTNELGWEAGLDQSAAVVCDSMTQTRLPKRVNSFVFPLLSAESIDSFPKRHS